MPSPAPLKLLNVQGLRAYGALAVAFYHTGFTLGHGRSIGSFGVGIFFVISGFIMAMICHTNPEHFLARRVARIVPLYWLLTLVIFFIASVAPRMLGAATANPVFLVKSLLFIPYFHHDAFFPILFLGWSLNYEIHFYVLIAAALLISRPHGPLIASAVIVGVMLLIHY
jgi:peptidoglycan/LPS O-acetylase OafA/YrhL